MKRGRFRWREAVEQAVGFLAIPWLLLRHLMLLRRGKKAGLMRPPRGAYGHREEVQLIGSQVRFYRDGVLEWSVDFPSIRSVELVHADDYAIQVHFDSVVTLHLADGSDRQVSSSARGWGELVHLLKARELVRSEVLV